LQNEQQARRPLQKRTVMLLNNSPDSKMILPVALILLSVGLLLLSCGYAWQNDFFHGFCISLGLALGTGALVMLICFNIRRLGRKPASTRDNQPGAPTSILNPR